MPLEQKQKRQMSTPHQAFAILCFWWATVDTGYYDRVSYSTYILTVSYIAPSTPLSHDSTLPRARRVLDKQLSQQTNNETMRQTNTFWTNFELWAFSEQISFNNISNKKIEFRISNPEDLIEDINTLEKLDLSHSMKYLDKCCRKRLENPISIALYNSIEWKCIPWYGNILEILKYSGNKYSIVWKTSSFFP